jgi:hypothetical protein
VLGRDAPVALAVALGVVVAVVEDGLVEGGLVPVRPPPPDAEPGDADVEVV